MSTIFSFPAVTKQINHYGTVAWFHPCTDWTFCTGMDDVRTAFRMQERTAILGRPAYQYADARTDEPGAWTAIGTSAYSDESWHTDSTDLSGTNDDHFWIRFGFESDMATAAAGLALFQVSVTAKRRAAYHDSKRIHLSTTSTSVRYVPITAVLPAVGMSKVKAAFVLSTDSTDVGTLRYGLAYRKSKEVMSVPVPDPEQMGAWADVGTTKSASTANTRVISDTALTLTDAQWVQFGLIYDLSSAGSGLADLTCMVATR